jgi:hypothetical protein
MPHIAGMQLAAKIQSFVQYELVKTDIGPVAPHVRTASPEYRADPAPFISLDKDSAMSHVELIPLNRIPDDGPDIDTQVSEEKIQIMTDYASAHIASGGSAQNEFF